MCSLSKFCLNIFEHFSNSRYMFEGGTNFGYMNGRFVETCTNICVSSIKLYKQYKYLL